MKWSPYGHCTAENNFTNYVLRGWKSCFQNLFTIHSVALKKHIIIFDFILHLRNDYLAIVRLLYKCFRGNIKEIWNANPYESANDVNKWFSSSKFIFRELIFSSAKSVLWPLDFRRKIMKFLSDLKCLNLIYLQHQWRQVWHPCWQ